MEFKVERVMRYGREVWRHAEMDLLRNEQCLCLHCAPLDSCAVAKAGYKLCVENGVAYAMTRCPAFKHKEG